MTNLAPTPLSERLRSLVDTVQHNERTLRRFQNVELRLIGAQDFASFLDTLFSHLPQQFALAKVVLWLDDRAPILLELLEPGNLHALDYAQLKTSREGGLVAQSLCEDSRPWLGRPGQLDDDARRAFFGAAPTDVPASALLLPLASGTSVSGYLCLGSDDSARFGAGMATDILERFASIVTASLDNVAHRERLKQLGMTDSLTGLANRRYFDERVREELMRAVRYRAPVACLFIDIDGFKRINDSHGHQTGDRALAAVAACMRRQVRLGDTVARYGGEEFAALLQGDRSDALTVAERVRLAVQNLDVRDEYGERIALTVSIGVAARVVAGTPAEAMSLGRTLLDEADRAMYRAKRNGRNRIEAQVDAGD
ncbi:MULTISPECIES: GGDEF domain-containing protein [Paraburkholderia]|uniref:diguanylate cyclase n=1 Tax=Paraburkholderia podalyriae TaxID=1938811 RepID=A0ABR7PUX0_9BURK|nr:GGDEF domain-containing protein [Paraburkholderia podalyriae]MBC8750063.1 sensor domain-containing diguanylate cyclase [Paraburkholderia podalyriae]